MKEKESDCVREKQWGLAFYCCCYSCRGVGVVGGGAATTSAIFFFSLIEWVNEVEKPGKKRETVV